MQGLSFCTWILSLNMRFSSFTYIFFSWVNNILLYMGATIPYPFPHRWAWKLLLHVGYWEQSIQWTWGADICDTNSIFFGCILKSGVCKVPIMIIVLYLIFWGISLPFSIIMWWFELPRTVYKVPFPTSSPALVHPWLFIAAVLTGGWWYLTAVFDLCFPDDLILPIAISISSLEKCQFRSFVPLINWVISFLGSCANV